MNNAQNDIIEHHENHIAYMFSHLPILHKRHIITCNNKANSNKRKRKKRLKLYNYFVKKLKTK